MPTKLPDLQLIKLEQNKQKKERAPKVKNSYKARMDKDEFLLYLGLTKDEVGIASLSDQEINFIVAMISNGCDKIAAYKSAFNFTDKITTTERHQIEMLLRKDSVRNLLRRGLQKKMSESLDNLDAKLLDTYILRAFYDTSDFYYDDGEPKPLSEIDESLRKAVIEGIDKKYYGKDADVNTVIYKLADKEKALKTLSDLVSGVRPDASSGIEVTTTTKSDEDEELRHIAEMSDDELRAEIRKLG